jgi:hypothetical protein
MVRRPNSGDTEQSSVYYLASADLGAGDFGPGDFGPADARFADLSLADIGLARPPALSLDEADPLGPDAPAGRTLASGRGYGGGWSGAGGRWMLWPLRAVLWAALLVVAFRGVTAIVLNQNSASPAPVAVASGTSAGTQFPVALAEAYAAEFGRVYLNFSPQNQDQREQQLAAFVPASLAAANPDLGWNGTGQMSLQSEQVAGIAVQGSQHAVVTLLASVNGQLMELGVPIAASSAGVVVSGEPAWLPAPAQISPPASGVQVSDPKAQSQLMNQLPAFFQAYANGDTAELNPFLARGVALTGLGGTMAFDSITGLHVPPGGSTREITVSVIWQLVSQGTPTGAKLQVTYSMSVVQQSGVKWYVKEISAAIEAVGSQ